MREIVSAYSTVEVRRCRGYLDKEMRSRETRWGEFKFFIGMAKRTGGPILELACGACRVSMVLAKAGFRVWGLEASPSMIRLGRKALDRLPERVKNRVHLVKGDMCNFGPHDFGDRKFPLVIIPYTSFTFNFDRLATKILLSSSSILDSVEYGKKWEGLFLKQATDCVKSIISVLNPKGIFVVDNPQMRGEFWKMASRKFGFSYSIMEPYDFDDVPVLVGKKLF